MSWTLSQGALWLRGLALEGEQGPTLQHQSNDETRPSRAGADLLPDVDLDVGEDAPGEVDALVGGKEGGLVGDEEGGLSLPVEGVRKELALVLLQRPSLVTQIGLPCIGTWYWGWRRQGWRSPKSPLRRRYETGRQISRSLSCIGPP